MSRWRLVTGSLAGAVVIHVVFVACSTVMRPDAGQDGGVADSGTDTGLPDNPMIDVARDVMDEVIDAETGTADAQDSGCGCPTPPAPPTKSFRISGLTVNGTAITPDRDYSTLSASVVRAQPGAGATGTVGISGVLARFYTPDTAFTINCSGTFGLDGAPSGQGSCYLLNTTARTPSGYTLFRNGPAQCGGMMTQTGTLTDTSMSLTLSGLSTTCATQTTDVPVTLSSITITMTDLSAHFLETPRDLTP